jgi:hypothetical protein
LAASANVSIATLRRMEASDGPASGYANNVAAVRRALESAGVEFIAENGGGAGVRLRKAPASNWALDAIANAPTTTTRPDDELWPAYLDKGPCLVAFDGGGEAAATLRDALVRVAQIERAGKLVTSIQVLGLAYIGANQVGRLLARLQ